MNDSEPKPGVPHPHGPPDLPAQARCTGCGYLLRHLPSTTCPECGRSFDPDDPATFNADPSRRRRRRLARYFLITFVMAATLYLLRPRQTFTSTLTWTCQRCGASTRVTRTEWVGPSWAKFHYPGYSWRSESAAPDAPDGGAAASEAGGDAASPSRAEAASPDSPGARTGLSEATSAAGAPRPHPAGAGVSLCPPHALGLHVDIKTLPKGGMFLPLPAAATCDVFLNGQLLTPDTAGPILHQVMTGGGGISLKVSPRS